MKFLPIFLDLADKKCVVVGGGEVAQRKAKLLLRASAKVNIISVEFTQSLRELSDSRSTLIEQPFTPSHLAGAALIVAATDSATTNKEVAKIATELNIPVNVVDMPELCSCIMPALIDRSPVVIAVSTGGNSPVLTRKIKELVEVALPNNVGLLSQLMGSWRNKVKKRYTSFSSRLKFWEQILESEVPDLVFKNRYEEAEKRIGEYLEKNNVTRGQGEVYLVGAGPGDPDLLTLRALRLMYQADIVLYDRLVSKEILEKVRPDSELISVGKSGTSHTVEQGKINDMLISFSKEGKKVLRLKGGDPFIFGRGGEEIEELAKEGIPFQIVPGITAASGCGSYAGIPLTHRDCAQSVRFLAGHMKDGELKLDWRNLVSSQQTLVFYMGLLSINTICAKLIKHGMDPSTPIAAIEHGTTRNQRVSVSNLREISSVLDKDDFESPTLLIIGDVVTLRERLSWYG